jgi:hypothetical protein
VQVYRASLEEGTKKVTKEGVLVRRPLIEGWGDVKEVEIEQRPDAIMITPKGAAAVQLRDRMIDEMKAAGRVEETPWTPPPAVSEGERARAWRRCGAKANPSPRSSSKSGRIAHEMPLPHSPSSPLMTASTVSPLLKD